MTPAKRRVRRTNEKVLADLVETHSLSARTLARLTHVSEHTVSAWLKPKTSSSHRRIPDGLLELLCIKLGEDSPFRD